MDTSSCLDGSLKRRGQWLRSGGDKIFTLGRNKREELHGCDQINFFFEVDLCKCDVHTPGGSTILVHLCRQLKRSLPG